MSVTDSEIVGLVPGAAVAADDVGYLRLVGFDAARQVLERLIDDEHEEGER